MKLKYKFGLAILILSIVFAFYWNYDIAVTQNNKYYSDNPIEARNKFLKAAERSKAVLHKLLFKGGEY